MGLAASIRKEWMEQARTGRLIALAAVLIFFGLTSPLLARYTPEIVKMVPGGESISTIIPTPTMMDAVGQFIKNVDQFGVLLALILTMGMVVQEKERGTAAIMLTKPLQRPAFVLAKFTALSLSFFACILVAALGSYYYTLVLFQAPDFFAWMLMELLVWLHIEVYVALVTLFSTLFRSQAAAAGLGFAIIILFALIGVAPAIARNLPDALLVWAGSLFTPLPNPAWGALGVSLGIIVISLLLAVMIFQRQEI